MQEKKNDMHCLAIGQIPGSLFFILAAEDIQAFLLTFYKQVLLVLGMAIFRMLKVKDYTRFTFSKILTHFRLITPLFIHVVTIAIVCEWLIFEIDIAWFLVLSKSLTALLMVSFSLLFRLNF